jgi:hypothetical protein
MTFYLGGNYGNKLQLFILQCKDNECYLVLYFWYYNKIQTKLEGESYVVAMTVTWSEINQSEPDYPVGIVRKLPLAKAPSCQVTPLGQHDSEALLVKGNLTRINSRCDGNKISCWHADQLTENLCIKMHDKLSSKRISTLQRLCHTTNRYSNTSSFCWIFHDPVCIPYNITSIITQLFGRIKCPALGSAPLNIREYLSRYDNEAKLALGSTYHIETWCPKAGIVDFEKTSTARQQLGKHIPAAKQIRKQQSSNFRCYATAL